MHVVVVESPAKAKTINQYLGPEYKVLASFGHIRDLPSKDGSVLPDQDFAMVWNTQSDGARRLKSIADAVKSAKSLILATDPDREGEAISWHVIETLASKKALRGKTIQRVAFNAITKSAVRDAMASPRELDQDLVDAYLARRALDYLVGFTLSPVLWRKLPGSRSAGRVQSVALRLIVDREIEIETFNPKEYWSVESSIKYRNKTFDARLYALDQTALRKFDLNNKTAAHAAANRVENAKFSIASVDAKQIRLTPPAPFTTSTLQQEASRKLGFDARRTMATAQKLYEAGHITYMRTDGVQMAEEAYTDARQYISQRFSDKYLPDKPRRYTAKSKNAQEAHEAIRPTRFSSMPDLESQSDHQNLYQLILMRAVASQMQQTIVERTTADLCDPSGSVTLRASGQVVVFDGYQALYREGQDDSSEQKHKSLPPMTIGDPVDVDSTKPAQHFTEPPARYSESSLVRKMEEIGIGRPSTYGATLSTLRDRQYVRMERKRFLPEDNGRLVTLFLSRFFAQYIAYDFTAELEERLDLVSDGKLGWKKLLADFWGDFKTTADQILNTDRSDIIDALDSLLENTLFQIDENGNANRSCSQCENGRLGLKLGKRGAFIGCSNYPDCRYTRDMNGQNEQQQNASDDNRVLGSDPDTGKEILLRSGPYGPYVQIDTGSGKPKRSSIPKGWETNSITLDKAIALLSLPRQIGQHPDDKQPVIAGTGRYGPYVAHNKVFASLESVEEVFEIGINRAVSLISDKKNNPKNSRTSAKPIKTLGVPPNGGEQIDIFKGRYGPYVKQGSVNASLPRNADPENISMEQALELIADRKKKKKTTRSKKS